MLTSNFPMHPTLKSVQISKVLANFCANFKSEKQAFLKVTFWAFPLNVSQKRYSDNYKQLKSYIFGYQNF